MNNRKNFKKAMLCTSIAAVLGSAAVSANILEETVVTAQKREQNLQDVGISITALSGDQMLALGLDNTQEITQQVPGLQMQTFTPALMIFNIRGISQANFQDTLEAPVAAYFDDVYVGSMNAIGGQIFDMERTEVLRGPQGTLFGRNATGGLLHFITKKANDDEFNGYIQSEVSEYNSYNVEGAVGGALSDSARFRLAGRWEQSDGYLEPGPLTPEGRASVDGAFGLPPGTTPEGGDGSDSIGADGFALRGTMQFDISENTSIDLAAAYSEDNDAPVGQYVVNVVPIDENGFGVKVDAGNPLTGDVYKHGGDDFSIAGADTGLDRDMTSLTARIASELSNGMAFTSITNWLDMDKSHRENAGGGAIPFPFQTDAKFEQWSQEFRLSGEADTYRWQVGAYYLNMKTDARSAVGGPFFGTDALSSIDALSKLESTNWSLFGQVEFDMSDNFTLIAGYRWSQDDKEIEFQNVVGGDGVDDGAGGTFDDGTVLFDLNDAAVGEFSDVPDIDYGDYAARLQLNWQANDDTLVFVSYNRGIKGGNWSPSAAVTIENFKHDEETLNAYELGVKSTFADGLARLNATVFYYDYKDYQAFSLLDFVPQVTNSDASAQGGELELTLLPNSQWDIMAGLSYIDSEVDKSPGAFPGTFIEDSDFPSAPEYSVNYLIRYNWDALNGNLAVQMDGVYNDDQFLEGHNGGSSIQESYGTNNVSVSYTSGDESWMVRGWVKNFNDEEIAQYSLDVGGLVIRQYAPPRWCGLTASYSW